MAPRPKKEDREKDPDKEQQRAARLKEIEQLLGLTLLTLDELSQRLQINMVTLRRHIASGRLVAYQPGRSYLIKETDAFAYLESFRVPAPASEGSASYVWDAPPQEQQPTSDQAAYLKIEDLMLLLRRSKPFILKDIEEGRLACWDIGGEYRIPVKESLRYLESFKVEPEQEEDSGGE